MILRNIHKKSV